MSRLVQRLKNIEAALKAVDEGCAMFVLFGDETKDPAEYRLSFDGPAISEAETEKAISNFREKNRGRTNILVRIITDDSPLTGGDG